MYVCIYVYSHATVVNLHELRNGQVTLHYRELLNLFKLMHSENAPRIFACIYTMHAYIHTYKSIRYIQM